MPKMNCALLRSMGSVSGYAIIAVMGIVACNSELTGPPKDILLPGLDTLVTPATGVADGASQLRIVAIVDTTVARDQRSVVFKTTGGSFGGNKEITVPADTGRNAVVFLTAPSDTSKVIVTATVGGATTRREVQFTAAPPERLELTTDQFSIAAGFSSITVTALLRRTIGIPTAGVPVRFSAHDTTGRARGQFSTPAPSDAAGKVVVRYTPSDSSYVGRMIIVAEVTVGTSRIADSTGVQVTPPPK